MPPPGLRDSRDSAADPYGRSPAGGFFGIEYGKAAGGEIPLRLFLLDSLFLLGISVCQIFAFRYRWEEFFRSLHPFSGKALGKCLSFLRFGEK